MITTIMYRHAKMAETVTRRIREPIAPDSLVRSEISRMIKPENTPASNDATTDFQIAAINEEALI